MKTVILGGGIAGLLAAYVCRDKRPLLIEGQSKLGGAYLAGGLKYIRHTPEMEQLLRELDINWSLHKPVGLLRWAEQPQPHPSWLASLPPEVRQHIQRAHWLKTRGTSAGFQPTCLNDPMGNGGDIAMDCDHALLIQRLIEQAGNSGVEFITGAKLQSIGPSEVDADIVVGIAYDHLIPTIPLGVLGKLAPHANLPQAQTTPLTIVTIKADDRPPSWDYMYTPQLRWVSRIVWKREGEFNAEVPMAPWPATDSLEQMTALLADDLSKALSPFADRIDIEKSIVIGGHLKPLPFPPSWPDNWHPLGRFAEWNARATAEQVLNRAIQIARDIG